MSELFEIFPPCSCSGDAKALLLADEPTGNLDSENSKEIISLLRKFNKENNQTVVIITHDDRIALSADRVITIEDGQITRDSKKEGVMAS